MQISWIIIWLNYLDRIATSISFRERSIEHIGVVQRLMKISYNMDQVPEHEALLVGEICSRFVVF